MRILMIGSNTSDMLHEVLSNSAHVQQVRQTSASVEYANGVTVECKRVCNPQDVELLRGVRYDFIIEHSSFCRDYELLCLIRMMVLR